MYGYDIHRSGNKNSSYDNRVLIDSSMHTYGYSSRDHQQTTRCNYGRRSAEGCRVHPEPSATRQTPDHHHPSYSVNMAGWHSVANPRQTSYNIRNQTDVISTKNKINLPMSECHSVDYCEVCCCAINGPKAFECHVNGIRHKKNLKNRAEGRPIKKARSSKSNSLQCEHSLLGAGQAQIMPILNNTREPLIGLQFVTEYQKSDVNSEPHYVCTMCDTTCDPRILLPHLIGFKHRINYMKEHYPSYYATIKQAYQKKSEQIPLAEEYACKIECEEGRQEVKVISEGGECSEGFSKPVADDVPDTTLQTSGKRKAFDLESTNKRCCVSSILGDSERKLPYSASSNQLRSNQDQSADSSYSCESHHLAGFDQELVNHNRLGRPALNEPDLKTDNTPGCRNVRWKNNDINRMANSRDTWQQEKKDDRSWSTSHYHGGVHHTLNSNQPDWADHHDNRSLGLQNECSTSDLNSTEKGQSSKDTKIRSLNQGRQTSSAIGRFLEEMANCVVKSEEDAEMALHVSNTLTKALMDYRMKDLSRKLESRAMKRPDEPIQKQVDT